MPKNQQTEEVRILRFFEEMPLEQAEMLFHIVRAKMWRRSATDPRPQRTGTKRKERLPAGVKGAEGRSADRLTQSLSRDGDHADQWERKKGRVSCRARRGDRGGNLTVSPRIFISPTRRVHGPGQTNPKPMAWRPYSNLMAGELDNRTPGIVTGWMLFFRNGKSPLTVVFDLVGDFHEDIRGTVIKLSNPKPSDEYQDEGKTYMDGFSRVQRGTVGDITAGLPLGPWTEDLARKLMEKNELYWEERNIRGSEHERQRREFSEQYRAHIAAGDLYYPYVEYPYIEWYAANGRVVLELDLSQVEIVKSDSHPKEKTAAELLEDGKKREKAFASFFGSMVEDLSRRNREKGGDGNVTGIVV